MWNRKHIFMMLVCAALLSGCGENKSQSGVESTSGKLAARMAAASRLEQFALELRSPSSKTNLAEDVESLNKDLQALKYKSKISDEDRDLLSAFIRPIVSYERTCSYALIDINVYGSASDEGRLAEQKMVIAAEVLRKHTIYAASVLRQRADQFQPDSR